MVTLYFREQQLLNIFEIVITTLEGKLHRIDSLDKSVDIIMQHIEVLQSRVANNMVKTDLIIAQLHNIANGMPELKVPHMDDSQSIKSKQNSSNLLEEQLIKLDHKVSGIDTKLEDLKVQIDNNFLQVEELYGEASEKSP